ncbi:MAG: MauE/DoxX family redox-associated membrane protein [Desulforhopalus sp.]
MESKSTFDNLLMWADYMGRWVIGLIFLFAAIPKLFNVQEFASTIDAYGMLSDVFVYPMAVVLPIVEILLAVGLVFNHFKSKIGTLLLLLFFILLLSYSIHLGLDIDCGCFGPEDPEHHAFNGLRQALARDVIMLIPLAYSFWYHRYRHFTS